MITGLWLLAMLHRDFCPYRVWFTDGMLPMYAYCDRAEPLVFTPASPVVFIPADDPLVTATPRPIWMEP